MVRRRHRNSIYECKSAEKTGEGGEAPFLRCTNHAKKEHGKERGTLTGDLQRKKMRAVEKEGARGSGNALTGEVHERQSKTRVKER